MIVVCCSLCVVCLIVGWLLFVAQWMCLACCSLFARLLSVDCFIINWWFLVSACCLLCVVCVC